MEMIDPLKRHFSIISPYPSKYSVFSKYQPLTIIIFRFYIPFLLIKSPKASLLISAPINNIAFLPHGYTTTAVTAAAGGGGGSGVVPFISTLFLPPPLLLLPF